MEDGSISDEQITASEYASDSDHDDGDQSTYPWRGRLNDGIFWATDFGPTDPWIQVDLLNTITVAGIKSQGGANLERQWTFWVTALKVQTGESERALTFIMEVDNNPKVRELNVLSNFI